MKKGISLIVLVITIIIIIILAGAVILSLNSTNVIAKANLSKVANERSTMQEVAQDRINQWQLMTEGAAYTSTDIFAAQTSTTPAFTLAAYTALAYPSTGTKKGDWMWNDTAKQVVLKTTVASGAGSLASVASLLGITTTMVTENSSWIKCSDGTTSPAA